MATLHSQKEPLWQTLAYPHHSLPKKHKDWLLDRGSLTQKLVTRSRGEFRVRVLQQRIQRPFFSEAKALKLPPQQWAVVREVLLYGHNSPWVYARTVIPLSTLKGPLRRLHHLGNRPLGQALFADPSMQRLGVEIARIDTHHLPNSVRSLQPRWGRRSLFLLKNKPLLVGEIFLKDLVG